MKKIVYVPIVAFVIVANISLIQMQSVNENDFSLKSLFSINSAEAETSVTYTCWDAETFSSEKDESVFWNRVCDAPDCIRQSFEKYDEQTKCSVTH